MLIPFKDENGEWFLESEEVEGLLLGPFPSLEEALEWQS